MQWIANHSFKYSAEPRHGGSTWKYVRRPFFELTTFFWHQLFRIRVALSRYDVLVKRKTMLTFVEKRKVRAAGGGPTTKLSHLCGACHRCVPGPPSLSQLHSFIFSFSRFSPDFLCRQKKISVHKRQYSVFRAAGQEKFRSKEILFHTNISGYSFQIKKFV